MRLKTAEWVDHKLVPSLVSELRAEMVTNAVVIFAPCRGNVVSVTVHVEADRVWHMVTKE